MLEIPLWWDSAVLIHFLAICYYDAGSLGLGKILKSVLQPVVFYSFTGLGNAGSLKKICFYGCDVNV